MQGCRHANNKAGNACKPGEQNVVSERTVREQFRVKHAGDETLRPRSETLDFLKYCGSTDGVTPSSSSSSSNSSSRNDYDKNISSNSINTRNSKYQFW